MRAAQAPLEIELEQRRAQGARVASLAEESARLSLIGGNKVKEERDSLVSVMFEGGVEGLLLAQQA